MKWIRATRKAPCPICKKHDWCGYSADGRYAICMRVPSGRATRNGGYLHRTGDPFPAWHPPPPRPKPRLDLAPLLEEWKKQTGPEAWTKLADQLGVSLAALLDLGAVWAAPHQAWAFPMRNEHGKPVGIRLRAETGRKWAVRGSQEGLFYPDRSASDDTIVICEGPTDTAAALTLGLWAVGRASCMGGVNVLKALCRRLGIKRAVVIGDNDSPKRRPHGGYWQPGYDGARKLIGALGIAYRLMVPPAKDLREWLSQGGTREAFETLINQQGWRYR